MTALLAILFTSGSYAGPGHCNPNVYAGDLPGWQQCVADTLNLLSGDSYDAHEAIDALNLRQDGFETDLNQLGVQVQLDAAFTRPAIVRLRQDLDVLRSDVESAQTGLISLCVNDDPYINERAFSDHPVDVITNGSDRLVWTAEMSGGVVDPEITDLEFLFEQWGIHRVDFDDLRLVELLPDGVIGAELGSLPAIPSLTGNASIGFNFYSDITPLPYERVGLLVNVSNVAFDAGITSGRVRFSVDGCASEMEDFNGDTITCDRLGGMNFDGLAPGPVITVN